MKAGWGPCTGILHDWQRPWLSPRQEAHALWGSPSGPAAWGSRSRLPHSPTCALSLPFPDSVPLGKSLPASEPQFPLSSVRGDDSSTALLPVGRIFLPRPHGPSGWSSHTPGVCVPQGLHWLFPLPERHSWEGGLCSAPSGPCLIVTPARPPLMPDALFPASFVSGAPTTFRYSPVSPCLSAVFSGWQLHL